MICRTFWVIKLVIYAESHITVEDFKPSQCDITSDHRRSFVLSSRWFFVAHERCEVWCAEAETKGMKSKLSERDINKSRKWFQNTSKLAEKCFHKAARGVGTEVSERERRKIKSISLQFIASEMLFCSFISLFFVFDFFHYVSYMKKIYSLEARAVIRFSQRLIAVQCSWVFTYGTWVERGKSGAKHSALRLELGPLSYSPSFDDLELLARGCERDLRNCDKGPFGRHKYQPELLRDTVRLRPS